MEPNVYKFAYLKVIPKSNSYTVNTDRSKANIGMNGYRSVETPYSQATSKQQKAPTDLDAMVGRTDAAKSVGRTV